MSEAKGFDVGNANEAKLKGSASFDSKDMYFRADKIDLKSLDIQLEQQFNKAWTKNSGGAKKPKEEWEIDLAKLEVRYVVAQGTYGTVYRGTYDGQDVAGNYFLFPFENFGNC